MQGSAYGLPFLLMNVLLFGLLYTQLVKAFVIIFGPVVYLKLTWEKLVRWIANINLLREVFTHPVRDGNLEGYWGCTANVGEIKKMKIYFV